MLSRCCDGCSLRKACKVRFINAKKGEFCFCPDGSKQLIDTEDYLEINGVR